METTSQTQRTSSCGLPPTDPLATQSIQERLRGHYLRRENKKTLKSQRAGMCLLQDFFIKRKKVFIFHFFPSKDAFFFSSGKVQRALKKLFKENLPQMIKNQGESMPQSFEFDYKICW